MTTTKQPTVAVIYCRTACTPHLGGDTSLLAQEETCRAYAAAHGIEISGVYCDPGISGLSADDRPGWQAIMQFLQRTPAPHDVLVMDETRLARDSSLCAELQTACTQLGHVIIAIDRPRY